MLRLKHVPIITAVSLAVIALVSIFFLKSFFKYDSYNKQDFIDHSAYQAVFLTNDQIYFGHLKNISSDYLILSDVYYVKISDGGAGQLVKLGVNEPHGPKEQMIINRDHVLYWENLKANSQVVETIKKIQLK